MTLEDISVRNHRPRSITLGQRPPILHRRKPDRHLLEVVRRVQPDFATLRGSFWNNGPQPVALRLAGGADVQDGFLYDAIEALFKANPSDGNTLTLNNGSESFVFEFDNNGLWTPGNHPVSIGMREHVTLRNLIDTMTRLEQEGSAATGVVTFADQPVDTNTVTINDGTTSLVFEFDNNASITGDILVEIGSVLADTIQNFINAVNFGNAAFATGSITFTGDTQPGEGATVTIGDDLQDVTFEFRDDEVAATATITCVAFAELTTGDYILITEPDGTTHAFWFDLTGSDVIPGGAAAADNEYVVDVSGDTTDAQVATTLAGVIDTAAIGLGAASADEVVTLTVDEAGDAGNDWQLAEFVDAAGFEVTAFTGGDDNEASAGNVTVRIGSAVADTRDNLIAAINDSALRVTAEDGTGGGDAAVDLTADIPGEIGNTFTLASDGPDAPDVSGAEFEDGADNTFLITASQASAGVVRLTHSVSGAAGNEALAKTGDDIEVVGMAGGFDAAPLLVDVEDASTLGARVPRPTTVLRITHRAIGGASGMTLVSSNTDAVEVGALKAAIPVAFRHGGTGMVELTVQPKASVEFVLESKTLNLLAVYVLPLDISEAQPIPQVDPDAQCQLSYDYGTVERVSRALPRNPIVAPYVVE